MNKKGRKGNHDLKWSSPFDYQPKSRALATFFSPRTKQKKTEKEKSQKNQKPKTHKSRKKKTHQENPFPREVLSGAQNSLAYTAFTFPGDFLVLYLFPINFQQVIAGGIVVEIYAQIKNRKMMNFLFIS